MKHRQMKFACIMGFLDMADRMVWPPSLSRDRNWPRVINCTRLRVVGLRLEGNLRQTSRAVKTVCCCEALTGTWQARNRLL